MRGAATRSHKQVVTTGPQQQPGPRCPTTAAAVGSPGGTSVPHLYCDHLCGTGDSTSQCLGSGLTCVRNVAGLSFDKGSGSYHRWGRARMQLFTQSAQFSLHTNLLTQLIFILIVLCVSQELVA